MTVGIIRGKNDLPLRDFTLTELLAVTAGVCS